MEPNQIAVVGAGGHAKVVVATAQAAGFDVVGIYDDDRLRRGDTLLGVKVRGAVAEAGEQPAVLGIGENVVRRKLAEDLKCTWVTVVHPQAIVHESVEIGAGTVVFAGAVIQPETVIGRQAIVNTGATIDHDCHIGDYVHVAPGVNLAGSVAVEEGVLMGIGACAIPGISVGAWAIVGAGAAITADVPAHVVARGVPARTRD